MSNQLNINPENDKQARDNGLGHWSCVSPVDCGLWVRSDGCHYANSVFTDTKNDHVFEIHGLLLFPALRLCDEKYPIGSDWQQPRYDLVNRRIEILQQPDVSESDRVELTEIEQKLSAIFDSFKFYKLDTPEDIEAKSIVQRAASLLKKEQPTTDVNERRWLLSKCRGTYRLGD